MYTAFNYLTRI